MSKDETMASLSRGPGVAMAAFATLAVVALIAAGFPGHDVAPTDTANEHLVPFQESIYALWEVKSGDIDPVVRLNATAAINTSDFYSLSFWLLEKEEGYPLLDWYWGAQIGHVAMTHIGLGDAAVDWTSNGLDPIVCDHVIDVCEQRRWVTLQLPKNKTMLLVAIVGTRGTMDGALMATPEDASMRELSHGPGFAFREDDFSGGVNVVSTVYGPLAKAQVIRDASIPMDVSGRLFAVFSGESNIQDLRMGYDHPTGSEDGLEYYLLHGTEPGSYRFRVDQSTDFGVFGVAWSWYIALWGAEVPLPDLSRASEDSDRSPTQPGEAATRENADTGGAARACPHLMGLSAPACPVSGGGTTPA